MARTSRLRNRLIRWLGGRPPEPSETLAPALLAGSTGELVLPAPDAAKQTVVAGRYFAHAEELLGRGAAELSAPYYRQAYALLRASLGNRAFHDDSISEATIDVDPTGLPTGLPTLAAPSQGPGIDPIDPIVQIRALRKQLTAETCAGTTQAVAGLRQAGLDHPELDHLEGLVCLIQGEGDGAAELFRRALSQAPDHFPSLVSLAGLLLSQERLEEAQALLLKALDQVNPDSEQALPALTNLSLVYQASGRPMDEALLILKIQRIKPGQVRAERLLGAAAVLEQMAEEPAAIELLQWLSENHSSDSVLQQLATLLERRGDYQAAALVYRRLLQPKAAPVVATP